MSLRKWAGRVLRSPVATLLRKGAEEAVRARIEQATQRAAERSLGELVKANDAEALAIKIHSELDAVRQASQAGKDPMFKGCLARLHKELGQAIDERRPI